MFKTKTHYKVYLLRVGLFLALILFCLNFAPVKTHQTANAAAGINRQISFQGKLVNPNGTNVTDGSYSIVFSIYSVSSGGSAIWTETQSPTLSNGIFQVELGSVTPLPGSVDFDTDNIYLGIKVGADAEMTPRIRFTAVPQAFNSEKLGGIDSTGFIQNTTLQQPSSNFNISGAGVVGTSLTTPTLQSAAATALTITGNAASTWSTTAGNLTIQAGSGTVSLGTSTALGSNGNLSIQATGYVRIGDSGTPGVATADDELYVLGDLEIDGNADFAGTLAVNGDLISSDGNLSIQATGYVRIGDSGTPTVATADDELYVLGDLEVDANTDLAGTLVVSGLSSLNGGLFISSTAGNRASLSNVPIIEGGVSGTTRVFRNLANFESNSNTEAGAIVIDTGIAPTTVMSTVTLKGYKYGNTGVGGPGHNIDIDISSYFNSPSFSNREYVNKGNVDPGQVRIGLNGSGNVVIVIGDTADTWSYPKLWLEKWLASHSSGADSLADNWSISMVTDLTGYTLNSVTEQSYLLSDAQYVNASGDTVSGALTITGLLTANGNIALQNGDTLTINSEAFDDLTGDGLTLSSGDLTVDATSATGFFRNGGNSFSGTATLGTNDANDLVLETANSPKLTIVNSTGNVGIGTTSSPEARLHVNQAASGIGLIIRNVDAGLTGVSGLGFQSIGTAATGYVKAGVLFEQTANAGRGTLHFATNNVSDSSSVTVSDSKLSITASGDVNISTGVLQTAGTTRLTSGGVLQNVTNADASTFFTGGSLTVARGGTGAGTFTANGVLFGNGTSALGVTAAGSTGQCLVATTASAPTWGTCTDSTGFVQLQGATPGSAQTGHINISGTIIAGSFSGNGANLTNLNASSLATGTVPSGVVSGSYTGITGTGALNAGSITSGFGNINIGASTFTTTGAVNTGPLTVSGQVVGGFGANSTSGTTDWDDITNARSGNGQTLLLGSATNGPGGGSYFHPFSFEYNSKNGSGNMTQLAVPYNSSGQNQGVYLRTRFSSSWTNWSRIIMENTAGNVNVGTVTAGTWSGTALTDAFVSDTLTSSLFVGSGSTTTAIDLATAEVAGTLGATTGGTGQSSYAVGDLLYANTTTTLARLADVAVGSCLISGGVGVAPSWGSCGAGSTATFQDIYNNDPDGGDVTLTTSSTDGNLNFAFGNAQQFNITSDLTAAARTTALINVTQANNASFNSNMPLMALNQQDTSSSAVVLAVTQANVSNAAISITAPTSGSGLEVQGVTTGTAITTASITSGNALFMGSSAFTTGNGLLFNTTSNALTSGNAIDITGSATGITANATGHYINVSPSRTLTAAAARTDTASLLNLTRTNTVNNASGTFNVQGDVASFSSSCTVTLGTCADNSNILDITQNYTAATGEALYVKNYGTGASFRVDDVASDTTPFLIDQNGNVGIGDATPDYQFDVDGTFTVASGSNIMSGNTLTVSPTSAPGAATTYISSFEAAVTADADVNANTILYGQYAVAQNNGAGTLGTASGVSGFGINSAGGGVTTSIGILGQIQNSGAGTTATGVALYGQSPSVTAGALTTAYGLFVAQQDTGAAVTTGYGIYQAGSDQNLLTGKLSIGAVDSGYDLYVRNASASVDMKLHAGGANSSATFRMQNDARSWLFQNKGYDSDNFMLYDETAARTILTVSSSTGDTTFGQNINWSGSTLTNDAHGGSIELGNANTPFIDFSNDGAADYDMRVVLSSNDALAVVGGELQVEQTIRVYGSNAQFIAEDRTTGSADQWSIYAVGGNTLRMYVNGADRAAFYDDGTFSVQTLAGATGNHLCYNGLNQLSTCSSSARYKHNIETAAWGLDTIQQMRPVTFNWNQDGKSDFGFVAEEMHDINPIFATYHNGVIEGVNYESLTSVAISGIQQLDTRTQEQKNQIDDQVVINTGQGAAIADLDNRASTLEDRLLEMEQQLQNPVFSSLNIAGDASMYNLSVTGVASIESLVVLGDATIEGNLTVTGVTEVADLFVNGKLVSKGDTPEVALGDALAEVLGAAVTNNGTDTAGTVVIASGSEAAETGVLAEITFTNPYEVAPKIVISGNNAKSAKLGAYVERTEDGFRIVTDDVVEEGVDYEFDYIIIEAQDVGVNN